MMNKCCFLLLLCQSFPATIFAQSKHEKIKAQLKLIDRLVGKWEVETEYTSRTGEVRKEQGIYEVSWALDSTYLKWTGHLTNPETGRQWEYISWLTFDSEKEAYRQTYLYSRSANIITEYGHFDSAVKTLITTTTLHLPDGVTERLRNEVNLSKPDELTYLGFAKFDDAEEVNNFKVVMRRKR